MKAKRRKEGKDGKHCVVTCHWSLWWPLFHKTSQGGIYQMHLLSQAKFFWQDCMENPYLGEKKRLRYLLASSRLLYSTGQSWIHWELTVLNFQVVSLAYLGSCSRSQTHALRCGVFFLTMLFCAEVFCQVASEVEQPAYGLMNYGQAGDLWIYLLGALARLEECEN